MATVAKAVCVYCGARDGRNPRHAEAAAETGRMLAANGWGLVYGAGDVGLMGRVAAAHQASGGRAMGVIPGHLFERERPGVPAPDSPRPRDIGRLVVTETMHERKKVMFANADAVVCLPGGAGSLDEFFEVLTWRQIGLHAKPILLLDVAGYWQPLLGLLRHVVEEGFAETSLLSFVEAPATVADLERRLRVLLT